MHESAWEHRDDHSPNPSSSLPTYKIACPCLQSSCGGSTWSPFHGESGSREPEQRCSERSLCGASRSSLSRSLQHSVAYNGGQSASPCMHMMNARRLASLNLPRSRRRFPAFHSSHLVTAEPAQVFKCVHREWCDQERLPCHSVPSTTDCHSCKGRTTCRRMGACARFAGRAIWSSRMECWCATSVALSTR